MAVTRQRRAAALKIEVRFFASAAAFRTWLQANHDTVRELWVGFYRKDSGRSGLTYDEALDQALCFGWIDGIKKKVDQASYTHRFTPRRPGSRWSAANVARVAALDAKGCLAAPGRRAFRDGVKDQPSGSSRAIPLSRALVARFTSHQSAWAFYREQPAGYRRLAELWVMDAVKAETRERRLTVLIDDSAAQRRIAPLRKTSASQRRLEPATRS